jgi:hypothetical protein
MHNAIMKDLLSNLLLLLYGQESVRSSPGHAQGKKSPFMKPSLPLFKQTVLSALFIITIYAQALASKRHDTAEQPLHKTDTLEKVSMIFEVKYAVTNQIDINNHPVIKNSYEEFTFAAKNKIPPGLNFSSDGVMRWQPDRQQFETLKEKPISILFDGTSTAGSFISGQVRIIGLGDLPAIDSLDSIAREPAIVTMDTLTAETDSTDKYKPISLIIPDREQWNTGKEGERIEFAFGASGGSGEYKFELIEPQFLMENLDQYGAFSWVPDFDFVPGAETTKSIDIKLKVFDTGGDEHFETITLKVEHVNRPPVVGELPTFYIQYNKENTYRLKKDGLTYDADGDSIVFTPVLKELPQGMVVNSNGDIRWKPSRRQVNYLHKNPIYLTFAVEDIPFKEKSIGQLKIEVSQADLPPEIAMIPDKKAFEINEDDELHLNFFVTDPNGETDLLTFGFVSENSAISSESLTKKEASQYEFHWTPGYDFITEAGEKDVFEISFYAIDRESNRTEKNIEVTVSDKENLLEKDRILYDQYRTVLERAFDLISQLNEKEKELERNYKKAKKGKKNRAITTASLGAVTGLSPIIFLENPNGQKIAAGIGGTATATIGTLEASNVIGDSPSDVMRNLNYVSQKRNDLLVYGNVFASKYALPVTKRDRSFQSDLRSLTIHLSLKEGANLDLDATWVNEKDASSKNLKKMFKDFNKDERFEKNYR